jgi:hypothetical protein
MKRKPKVITAPETVEIAEAIAEEAPLSLLSDRITPSVRCVVCGADAKPDANEQLCWVCRRLKISAWRDVEQQVPVQE